MMVRVKDRMTGCVLLVSEERVESLLAAGGYSLAVSTNEPKPEPEPQKKTARRRKKQEA